MSSPSTPDSRSHLVHKSKGSMNSDGVPSTPQRSAGLVGASSVQAQTQPSAASPSQSTSPLPSPYLRVPAAKAASSASPLSTPPPAPPASKASFPATSGVRALQAHHAVSPATASSTASPNTNLNSSTSSSTYTPSRKSASNTHAGGILPPASFFRPSRPNSTARPPSAAFSLSTSPVRSSPIAVGLPFKSPTASPSPASRPPSGLPSTFNAPAEPGRMAKPSREPLLPIVERKGVMARGRAVAAEPTAPSSNTGVGVRGSFERIWKKGIGMASSTAPSTPRRKSSDRKSSLSDADPATSTETHEKDLEVGTEESRNHYVQEETDMEKPRRLTIDDIGDGAIGGGVVMEMGRLSMADTSIISGTVDRTTMVLDDDETGVIIDDAIRFRPAEVMSLGGQPLESPRSPKTPGGGAAATFSFDAIPTTPNSAHPLAVPSTPGQRSRHAHFAPSPTRSPKAMPTPSILTPIKTSIPDLPISSSPPYLVPVLSPRTQKPVRNYEFHPSRNQFFFKGHLLAGGDSAWPFIGALVLTLGVAGTWFGTTSVFWWHRGGGGQAVAAVGAYLCALTISSMLMTAFRDPGILPRDLDPDPPCAPASSTASDAMPIPLPRDLRVRAGSVRVKYCITCKTYRPPRSSHCKMCDNCIDGCDHHCQWVNNCIGRRNYTTFITFVVTASVTCLLVLVTAFLHIYLLTHDESLNVKDALKKAPGSAVAVGITIVVIWPLMALALYHVRLLLLNITTIEQVRNQAHRKLTGAPTPPNPFSIGRWWHNLAYLLCRPPGFSWVDLPGYAMHDTRKVNPGFIVRPASTVEDADLEESRESGQWR